MLTWFQKAAADPTAQILEKLGCTYSHRRDGTYVVTGNINLCDEGLTELPDLSRVHVKGHFFCHNNRLTSLKGAPARVDGDFECGNNRLTTLKGAPAFVGGSFNCNDNELTTLEGAPQTVGGDFSCFKNRLTTLAFAPKKVGDRFVCNDNNLTTLEGGPATVGDVFWCQNNPDLDSLEYAPAAKQIVSDFGVFNSWDEVPQNLRTAPEKQRQQKAAALQSLAQQATVAQKPVALKPRIRLRQNKPTLPG